MKVLILFSSLLIATFANSIDTPNTRQYSATSTDSIPTLQPYFIALIVSDIETSIAWYQAIFELELVNEIQNEERGFKQANLRGTTMWIELIQLDNSLTREEALSSNPSSSRLQGLFKFGFRVDDFDRWIEHLTNSGIGSQRDVITDRLTNKRMIVFRDPDANRLQLFER